MTHSWTVEYDNRSQNPSTHEVGTDELDADTVLVRDGALKFVNDGDETPVAGYAPGYWAKYHRSS